MRYLLQDKLLDELNARRKFILEVFHLYMIDNIKIELNQATSFFELVSFPDDCIDICIVVGHNFAVKKMLTSNYIPESSIIVITCDKGVDFKNLHIPNKQLYLTYQNNYGYANQYIGKDYNFSFNPTESELILYRCPKDMSIEEKISNSFTRL